jgi:hypothetical protein
MRADAALVAIPHYAKSSAPVALVLEPAFRDTQAGGCLQSIVTRISGMSRVDSRWAGSKRGNA